MLDLILDVTPEEMDAANMDAANAEYYDSAIEPSAPEGMEDEPEYDPAFGGGFI